MQIKKKKLLVENQTGLQKKGYKILNFSDLNVSQNVYNHQTSCVFAESLSSTNAL